MHIWQVWCTWWSLKKKKCMYLYYPWLWFLTLLLSQQALMHILQGCQWSFSKLWFVIPTTASSHLRSSILTLNGHVKLFTFSPYYFSSLKLVCSSPLPLPLWLNESPLIKCDSAAYAVYMPACISHSSAPRCFSQGSNVRHPQRYP